MEEPQQLPSLKEMAYSLTEAMVTSLKHAVERKAVIATEEQARARLDICLACEFVITQQEGPSMLQIRCGKCGCGMKVKTRLATSKCPINKWGPISN